MPADAPTGELLVHGTCVALSGCAALLRGAPGSGKSDLALRFITAFGDRAQTGEAACLVSDDQVLVSRTGETLRVRAPATIAGKLEVRGVGIVNLGACEDAELKLVVDMAAIDDVPRLPPEPAAQEMLLGVPVPLLRLNPFEASCPVKLKLALTGRV